MNRYICIHGHFYQPPRENPWLETIELQDSAAPYHDWNKRITAECYAPNARSRILDGKERIIQIVNNYAKISFNFGPTLLSWMEDNAPDTYKLILEADTESRKYFSGHGSALAQAYNHMILPLANYHDKYTQISWGIYDFKHRFGRRPEGMWLPETAVDLETLNILKDQGIDFTILAPHQANRVRAFGEKEWQDIEIGKIDSTMPYLVNLPSGKTMILFFYDGPISRAIAFERLLGNGEEFAKRLTESFSTEDDRPAQMVHIATDGESYGHHHRFGEMALAYAVNYLETKNLARMINYGEYAEKFPPTHEVEIIDNTSWSCIHGVERWRGDCGCSTGSNPGWNQKWREPLRKALDRLRDKFISLFENEARQVFREPWEARNDYIRAIIERSDKNTKAFLERHSFGRLDEQETEKALKLMELQRHAMLMYTSCGWFFNDLSRIETIQILQYAGRAIHLAEEISGEEFESGFLKDLESAKSNKLKAGTGRQIYEKYVRPAKVDLKKICAHHAIRSLFDNESEKSSICCYDAIKKDYRRFETGNSKLAFGVTEISSRITGESSKHYFGVMHMGDHNVNCGVGKFNEEAEYLSMIKETSSLFEGADFPETLRMLDKYFNNSIYSLKSLYRDEQQRILKLILGNTLEDIVAVYRKTHEQHLPIMLFLKDSETLPPDILQRTAELVINDDLEHAFAEETLDLGYIGTMLEKAETLDIPLKGETLEYAIRKSLERRARALQKEPSDLNILRELNAAMDLTDSLPFQLNLWTIQNICYDMLESFFSEFQRESGEKDGETRSWIKLFTALCEKLSVRIN